MSFKDYADYYDLLYKDKDYIAEVDFLETFLKDKPCKILELGCGTGKYTQIFNKRGYDITGVDLSAEMIKIAKRKYECDFVVGDIKKFNLKKKFDLCIAMFAVIGYINKNKDLISAFKNIKKHLKPNGIFMFDVWNGLAVMNMLPEVRVKKVINGKKKIIRIAEPNLKPYDHICEVNYDLLIFDENNGTYEEVKEKHSMRFFFPQEIAQFLETTGFDVLKICPFLNSTENLDEKPWNMFVIAKVKE